MFNLNDIVDVPNRPNITHFGTIKELLPDNKAVVHFKNPRKPKKRGVCDGCKFPRMLSQNGGTGEIVCMSTGCGHNHGFEERDEIISLDLLVNITKKRDERAELSIPPRPWSVGYQNRGLGHGSYGVIDNLGNLIVGPISQATAELIVSAVNATEKFLA